MKNFFFIFLVFLLLIGFSEELDLYHYLFLSSLIFYLIYLYNYKNPIVLEKNPTLFLFFIQTIILWHVAFVYNDFLCVNPISYNYFICFFLIYICISLNLLSIFLMS